MSSGASLTLLSLFAFIAQGCGTWVAEPADSTVPLSTKYPMVPGMALDGADAEAEPTALWFRVRSSVSGDPVPGATIARRLLFEDGSRHGTFQHPWCADEHGEAVVSAWPQSIAELTIDQPFFESTVVETEPIGDRDLDLGEIALTPRPTFELELALEADARLTSLRLLGVGWFVVPDEGPEWALRSYWSPDITIESDGGVLRLPFARDDPSPLLEVEVDVEGQAIRRELRLPPLESGQRVRAVLPALVEVEVEVDDGVEMLRLYRPRSEGARGAMSVTTLERWSEGASLRGLAPVGTFQCSKSYLGEVECALTVAESTARQHLTLTPLESE